MTDGLLIIDLVAPRQEKREDRERSQKVIKGGDRRQNGQLHTKLYNSDAFLPQTTANMSGEIDAVYIYDEHK